MEEIKLDPSSSSRPTISFPLGVALLVIMLLLITAVFLCCLYWDRLRSYLLSTSSTTSHSQQHTNTASSDNIHVSVQSDFAHEKPIDRAHHTMEMQNDHVKSVTVVMPGDDVPKFIGMACPCKPPAPDKITVVLHKTLN